MQCFLPVFSVFGYKKCTPGALRGRRGSPAAPIGAVGGAQFVSYKGVCIDFVPTVQVNTVSLSVFTPPGWMQWQATQWSGLTSMSGGVLVLQPSQM